MDGAAESALVDAAAALGLVVSVGAGAPVIVTGHGDVRIDVRAVAVPTPGWVKGIVAKRGALVVVVGDQISAATGDVLRRRGFGWLDRRGHLRLVADGVLIDSDVPAAHRRGHVVKSTTIAGRSGLAAASALLLAPDAPMGVREIARRAGLNPSSISRAMTALVDARLAERIGAHRIRPLVPELFWALAEVWPSDEVVVGVRASGVPRGVDADGRGWVLGRERAAVAWGAPLVLSGDYAMSFYAPDADSLRVIGLQSVSPSRGVLRSRAVSVSAQVDPTGLVASSSHHVVGERCAIAHPLYCALDLARTSRGREALEQWSPPEGFARVW